MKIAPSAVLDRLYSRHGGALRQGASELDELENKKRWKGNKKEGVMLLDRRSGKIVAEALGVPELQAELERAVGQVGNALSSERKIQEEKEHLHHSEKNLEGRIKR